MLTNLPNKCKEKESIYIESLPFWQQSIISSIKSLQFAAGLDDYDWNRFSKKAILSLRPYIPYVVHGTYETGVYILLNRDYKPIGLNWFPNLIKTALHSVDFIQLNQTCQNNHYRPSRCCSA